MKSSTPSLKNKLKNSPLLKNVSLAFLFRVSGAFLLFIFNLAIVKLLGVVDSGVFFIAQTIVSIFATIGLFGLDHLTLRRISASKSPDQTKKVLGTSLILILISSMASAIIVAVSSSFLGKAFNSSGLDSVLILMSLSIPLVNLFTIMGVSLQAKKKYSKSIFILTNCVYVISICLLLATNTFLPLSLMSASTIIVISTVITLLVSYALARKDYNILESISLALKQDAANSRILNVYRDSLGLFVVSVLYLGFGWADIILVGLFMDESNVSIYSIASKVAKLITFALFAVNIILAPVIAKQFKENKIDMLNKEIQKATIISIALATPILFTLLIFPKQVLGLFGPEYLAGASSLQILALGQTINAYTGAVVVVFMMINKEKILNYLAVSALSLQLALGVITIPIFGITGMAFASFIGMTIINIIGVYYLSHYRGINIMPNMSTIKEVVRH